MVPAVVGGLGNPQRAAAPPQPQLVTIPFTVALALGVGGTVTTPSSGFPDASNSGYLHAPDYPGSLTPFTGTIESDTTYSFMDFTGGTDVGTDDAPVSNVTFIGCRFRNSGGSGSYAVSLCGDNLTLSYCTVAPLNTAAPPVAYADGYQYGITGDIYNTGVQELTVEHCDIWGFANATMTRGSTQAKPHRWHYNWVHDPRIDTEADADHTDGIGCPAGGTSAYVEIIGNSIMAQAPNADTQAVAFQNTPGPSSWDHFTITGNLFSGYGFTVNVIAGTGASPAAPTNLTFTDNVFSTLFKPIFGPLYDARIIAGAGSTWARNTWSVPDGAEWGDPDHDGWFWLPVDNNIPESGDDSAYVSLTDYTG